MIGLNYLSYHFKKNFTSYDQLAALSPDCLGLPVSTFHLRFSTCFLADMFFSTGVNTPHPSLTVLLLSTHRAVLKA